MSLRRLFWVFLRIGATGFGGMIPLLALVEEQVVERRKIVPPEEFADGVAIGQILPGPIVVDAVTHVGFRVRGWLGAVVSAVGLILPAFLLMLVLTPLYFKYGHIPHLAGAFKGIGGAVVGVVAAAIWRLGSRMLRTWASVAVSALAFLALAAFRADAVLTLVLCGALGFLFRRALVAEEKPK